MHDATNESGEQLETKYGLPREIIFCHRCNMSNQRPTSAVEYKHTKDSKKTTLVIDDEGICDACRVAEDKAAVDWNQRHRELEDLCDQHRRSDGRHDCIVPGSGGKDSFFQSHILKYKYGMNPLTVTWAPHIYTDWGWRNFQHWIHAGFDNILTTPNGRVHRLLTRLATDNMLHPFQPFIFGQKALAPKQSIAYEIPLVFYGENEAEYGNPRGDMSSAVRDWEYFTTQDEADIFFGGTSVAQLIAEYGLTKNDLEVYMPAAPDDLRRVGTEVHYLGHYMKWHPQGAYYYAQEHGGFEAAPERTSGTYSKYSGIDDKVDDFHFFTSYLKFGIGRTSYDSAQEIRSGDITTEEGIALIRRFDAEYPERFAKEVFEYLSIPEKEFPVAFKMFENPIMTREIFDAHADTFRSPHLWKFENGAWALRKPVWLDDA